MIVKSVFFLLSIVQGRVTNISYQSLKGSTRATAKCDLEDLVEKGIVVLTGKGRGAFYSLSRKRLINGSIGS